MRALAGAAAAFAAGYAAERLSLGRIRARAHPADGDDFTMPDDAREHVIGSHDGGKLRIIERGEGQPLLLVHGITLQASVWHYQLLDLAPRFRVLALDQRGHGQSVAGDDGYGIDRLGRDIATVLTELDLHDVVVVGHSMGGMALMQFCADHPDVVDERVAGLVFVSTHAAIRAPRRLLTAMQRAGDWMVAHGERTEWRRFPVYRFPPSDLAWFFARLAFGGRPAPVHVELTRAMLSLMPVEASTPSGVGLLHHDARESLADTRTPSIVVVGTRDTLTPAWEARLIAERLPVCELHRLPGAGHMPMYERRAELAEILTGFADGLAASVPVTPGG